MPDCEVHYRKDGRVVEMSIVSIIILWLGCSALSYGLLFAFFQGEFKLIAKEEYWKDVRFCLLSSLGGPLTLIVTLIVSRARHGIKFY
mgnify:CR=1 FL=1